jgi:excisionase family DNA binding protein
MTTAPVASWDQLPMFLTVAQVAAFMGLNHKTIRAAERDGRLKGVRIGRTLRFHRDEVRRFVESGGQPPEPVRRSR